MWADNYDEMKKYYVIKGEELRKKITVKNIGGFLKRVDDDDSQYDKWRDAKIDGSSYKNL